VTVEIEVGEILDGFWRASRTDCATISVATLHPRINRVCGNHIANREAAPQTVKSQSPGFASLALFCPAAGGAAIFYGPSKTFASNWKASGHKRCLRSE
jgi:hypothetical protein